MAGRFQCKHYSPTLQSSAYVTMYVSSVCLSCFVYYFVYYDVHSLCDRSGKITSCHGMRACLAESRVFDFHRHTSGRQIFSCTTGNGNTLLFRSALRNKCV